MKIDNRELDSVRVWSTATPDQISKRCLNYLMYEVYDFRRGWPELDALLQLFALPCGPRKGQYGHHDGWRCP